MSELRSVILFYLINQVYSQQCIPDKKWIEATIIVFDDLSSGRKVAETISVCVDGCVDTNQDDYIHFNKNTGKNDNAFRHRIPEFISETISSYRKNGIVSKMTIIYIF